MGNAEKPQKDKRRVTDPAFTQRALKAFRQVRDAKPDPQAEVFDRIKAFDERQGKRWDDRTED